ncbi:hypothetical protein [Salinibacillus xinjiangensis]|uniref:Uncharacterized protein n=1 Tax=Salinibacillus xinjiangensis TaxID=1229268 RepID=A0A6G1X4X5_9BACI|nr:hypothetical protein [Salinibacillus xinjiangensis]MRG86053.1 hypothetical protein [Salinibacillus xinjiangensis]
MNYQIKTVLEHNEKFSSFLHNKIKEFNNEHSYHHKEARKTESVQPINVVGEIKDYPPGSSFYTMVKSLI